MEKKGLTIEKVRHAREVLKSVLRETGVISATNLAPNTELYLKTENLQVTGSFKVRGAYYKMSTLTEQEKAKGVVACSAGNHAQGVALAAKKNGIKSVICLPEGAPIAKVEATRNYGAEICLVKGVYDDAYQKALSLRDEMGYTFIHPFDDPDVIAGQGTIALELLEQIPDMDAVIVPIGGGGLISGMAYTIKTINPKIKVYGVQAAGAPSMFESVSSGQIKTLAGVSTIADGIAVKQPGELTYEICAKYVDEIATVTDGEISAAILKLMEKQKLVTEGAGAVAVAAAMFGKFDLSGKKTVCLLSGGNIDVTILSRVITRGLVMTGRSCHLSLELDDKPGQLMNVSKIISDLGGNILEVQHERTHEGLAVTTCYLRIVLETRDYQHIQDIKHVLVESGIKIID